MEKCKNPIILINKFIFNIELNIEIWNLISFTEVGQEKKDTANMVRRNKEDEIKESIMLWRLVNNRIIRANKMVQLNVNGDFKRGLKEEK